MYYIFCIDEHGGRMFLKRRQSQDRALRERVLTLTAGHTLWMSTYSAKQFTEGGDFIVDDNYLQKAGEDDYCFIEDQDFDLSRCKGVSLYNWNRHYPAVVKWDVDLVAEGFTQISKTDFVGHSHERITEYVYVKESNP